MGKTKYKVGGSRKRECIISSRGANAKFTLSMAPAPWTHPSQLSPDKTLDKTAKIKSTFDVMTGTLSYELIFKYKLEKFSAGDGSIQWFPKQAYVTYGATSYKGPKTHFMEVYIQFNKIVNVGGGKEDMPQILFQLEQWYGPVVPVPGGGTKVITNGRLYMGAGKIWLAKTKW